jgi:hypothetical protein
MAYIVYVNTSKHVYISGGVSQGLLLNIFKKKCIQDKRFYALTEILLPSQ